MLEALLVLYLAWAIIVALIARYKGRSFLGWFIYALLIPPLAMIHALVMANIKKVGRKR